MRMFSSPGLLSGTFSTLRHLAIPFAARPWTSRARAPKRRLLPSGSKDLRQRLQCWPLQEAQGEPRECPRADWHSEG